MSSKASISSNSKKNVPEKVQSKKVANVKEHYKEEVKQKEVKEVKVPKQEKELEEADKENVKNLKKKEPETASATVVAEKTEPETAYSTVVVEKTEEHVAPSVEKQIEELLVRMESDRRKSKEIIVILRNIKKANTKQIRDAKKMKKRKNQPKADGEKRAPSGFARQTRIGKDLCEFLGLAPETLISRIEVTKKMHEYIKSHNLEREGNKRLINANEKLDNLLGNFDYRLKVMEARHLVKPKSKTAVTGDLDYFNLQTHLNPHFVIEKKERAGKEHAEKDVEQGQGSVASA